MAPLFALPYLSTQRLVFSHQPCAVIDEVNDTTKHLTQSISWQRLSNSVPLCNSDGGHVTRSPWLMARLYGSSGYRNSSTSF